MEVRFKAARYDRLETDPKYDAGFGEAVVRAYRKVVNLIRAATDERDIRAMKSLRMERLKGDRSHQVSLRLNDQWRLIIEIEPSKPKNRVVIIGIEDYH